MTPSLMSAPLPGIYTSVCAMCGYPLKTEEIAARFTGDLVDYEDRAIAVGANLDFCHECKVKIYQYSDEELDVAIRRMEEMKR